ncbi:MAG: hypothetical protein MK078_17290 [Crocinitomicaceae bacterium]|nr:hypothetical protein [Crocinitomicaceae bacterium]
MTLPTQKLFVVPFTFFLLFSVSCGKDKVNGLSNDPRNKYVGTWNFKGNGYYYSGYYIYTGPDMTAEWTYTESYSTDYNDSTGSVAIGPGENDLLIKYCETCSPVTYNLDESGTGSWWINEYEFYNNSNPAPPGYSPVVNTYNIQGWKID